MQQELQELWEVHGFCSPPPPVVNEASLISCKFNHCLAYMGAMGAVGATGAMEATGAAGGTARHVASPSQKKLLDFALESSPFLANSAPLLQSEAGSEV